MKIPKQPRLMQEQRVALQNLSVERAHCRGQHPHSSVNAERSSWYLQEAFASLFGVGRYSGGHRKGNLEPTQSQNPPPTVVLPARCAGGIEVQNLSL